MEPAKDGDNLELRIQLQNFSESTRVHVFAQQFITWQPDQMRDAIESALENKINKSTFPFAIWKNMFQTNLNIGDEIRYVLNR